MTSNKHSFFGWGPPTSTQQAATNCRATLGHIDRHIVAWAVAQGHRHRRLNSASLLWDIVGCQTNNNGGTNGIKLRLQKNRRQQLEQRGSSNCSRILLDDDGCGDAVCYRRKLERNFIPDLIFTKNWTWTLDRRPGTKDHHWLAEKAYWLWNQCWRKIQSKVAASSNQLFSLRCGKQHRVYFQRTRVAGIVSTSGPGEQSPGFFYAWIMDNRKKAQA